MQIYKALATFRLTLNGFELRVREGDKFLLTEEDLAFFPEEARKLFVRTEAKIPSLYRGEPLNDKHLLLLAPSGVEEVICLTPALRELKSRYPRAKISVAVWKKNGFLLEGRDYIDEVIFRPIPLKRLRKADYLVNTVEVMGSPSFENLNLVDFFLWKLYLYDTEDKTPDVPLEAHAKAEILDLLERIRQETGNKKLLLFNYLGKHLPKTLPPKILEEAQARLKEEYSLLLCPPIKEIGEAPISWDFSSPEIWDLSSQVESFRHLVALIHSVDAVVTADSVVLHIAAAFKKPTVLIFGPVDPECVSPYPTVIPLRAPYKGESCQAPCMLRVASGACKEAQAQGKLYSPCLEALPGEILFYAIKDAELLAQEDFPRPDKCILCGFGGNLPLFEVINGYRIFSCPSCGLQFVHPFERRDYDLYDRSSLGLLSFSSSLPYDFYLRVHSNREKERERWKKVPRINVLIPLLSALPKGKLLDVGCSSGFFLLIAEELGYEAYGMEESDKAVDIAINRFGLRVVKASSFEELPPDFHGPYKLITAFEVLEHLPDPISFLTEVYSLLEEGGFLLLSCPPFYRFENIARGFIKYKWWGNDYPPNHLTRWRPWTLFYSLKQAGFSEIYLFTEPFVPGTLFEGVPPVPFAVHFKDRGQVKIPVDVTTRVMIEVMKPLFINARNLGNFQYALAVKGHFPMELENIIQKAIKFSAVEVIWHQKEENFSQ